MTTIKLSNRLKLLVKGMRKKMGMQSSAASHCRAALYQYFEWLIESRGRKHPTELRDDDPLPADSRYVGFRVEQMKYLTDQFLWRKGRVIKEATSSALSK